MDDDGDTSRWQVARTSAHEADSTPAAVVAGGGGTWLRGIKSRLQSLSMADWLDQLGIRRRPLASDADHDDSAAPAPISIGLCADRHAVDVCDEQQLQHHGRAHSSSPQPGAHKLYEPLGCHTAKPRMLRSVDARASSGDSGGGGAAECNAADADPSALFDLAANYKDTLDLQHFGIMYDLVPLAEGQGMGHRFEKCHLLNPTWCDKCGDFIWGFVKQVLRCENCMYTCHYKCRKLVTLDCRAVTDSLKSSSSTDATYLTANSELQWNTLPPSFSLGQLDLLDDDEPKKDASSPLTPEAVPLATVVASTDNDDHWPGEQLARLIEHYNESAGREHTLTLRDDGTYTGCISVRMNFNRPVNVVAGSEPPHTLDLSSSADGDGTAHNTVGRKTITSFYLPRNTVKSLYIDSNTTTRQLISSLLRKFRVVDNACKFALYQRDNAGESTLKCTLSRVCESSQPLRLALAAGARPTFAFVLQENDSGDVPWELFEVPELRNFVHILELEQRQHAWSIEQRYTSLRYWLEVEWRARWPHEPVPNADGGGSTPTAEQGTMLPGDFAAAFERML